MDTLWLCGLATLLRGFTHPVGYYSKSIVSCFQMAP
jgi:hypothetical protein